MPDFPPELLRKYPHMFPNDIIIWERFLLKHANEFTGFDYDIKVGSVPKFPDGLDTGIYKAGEILWKKRIDAVGHKADELIIIEVKPNAGPSAIGQVLGYVQLYRDEIKPAQKVSGMIVTDRPDLDLYKIAENNLIQIEAV